MGGLGVSAALSAAGDVALLGGTGDDGDKGAAWAFANVPAVAAVGPASGPTGGGTQVTITGSDLGRATAVEFGSTATTSLKVVSPSELDAVSPPGAAGSVDVTVVAPAGTSATGAGDRFTYVAAPAAPPTVPQPPVAARDTVAPTAPRAFAGHVAGGALVLSWKPATDNVGVDHYQLLRDGKRAKRLARGATRLSMPGFRPKRRTVFVLRAYDAAGNAGPLSSPVAVVAVPRPKGVPNAIPAWAPRLLGWERAGRHGTRPKTPRTLPTWFARWEAWQQHPDRIVR